VKEEERTSIRYKMDGRVEMECSSCIGCLLSKASLLSTPYSEDAVSMGWTAVEWVEIDATQYPGCERVEWKSYNLIHSSPDLYRVGWPVCCLLDGWIVDSTVLDSAVLEDG